jgi:hypothetical protein
MPRSVPLAILGLVLVASPTFAGPADEAALDAEPPQSVEALRRIAPEAVAPPSRPTLWAWRDAEAVGLLAIDRTATPMSSVSGPPPLRRRSAGRRRFGGPRGGGYNLNIGVTRRRPIPWPGAAASFFAVALVGGLAQELTPAATPGPLSRTYAGPEFAIPRLFGDAGGAALGYQEELGWLRGPTAYVQTTLLPASRLLLLVRGSYFEDRADGALGVTREIGAFLHASYALGSWLAFDLSLLARQNLTQIDATTGGGGLTGRLGVTGSF